MTEKINNNKKTGDTLTANEWNELADAVNVIGGEIKDFYKVPEGGIPKEDLDEETQSSLKNANSAYQKPEDGITRDDLSEEVNDLLNKADNSLQQEDADNFASIEQAVPSPTSQDEGKILGYEAPTEGANPVVGWVEKPVDGDDAYHVWLEANGYDEKDHPVSEYNEYNRGKSAREIYNATYNKNLNDAEFAAELKMNYPMLHVGYNASNAGETVGVPFTGNLDPSGENIGASESTMGKLYLMPDAASDPENCIGFVTVLDGSTYKWCNVGAISIPSDALAKSNVDNECTDGATDEPASAKAVMDLKAKLEGVTASEEKVVLNENTNWYDGFYVRPSDGEITSTSAGTTQNGVLIINVEGVNKVRFLGFRKAGSSSANSGYGFSSIPIDTTNNTSLEVWEEYKNGALSDEAMEYLVDVPKGMKYFAATIRKFENLNNTPYYGVMTIDSFYCYSLSGKSVSDIADDLLENIMNVKEENIMAVKELSVSSEALGFIRIRDGLWSESISSYHGYFAMDEYVGQQIKVTNNDSKETNVAFVTAIDTVVGDGIPSYVEGWSNVVTPAAGELGGSQIFVVPEDAKYMYVFLGIDNKALPTVEVVQHVTKVVEDMLNEDDTVPVRLFPLWTQWHIRGDNGVIDGSNSSWEMFIYPVKSGDKLRLTATKNSHSELALVQYGFSANYPSVGDTITSTAIAGAYGETRIVELVAESDSWFVFSSSIGTYYPTWSCTLEMLLPLSEVVAPKMSKGLEYGMRELHFTDPLPTEAITETYSEIYDLYDTLVTNHGEAFERLSDILENDGSDNEIRLYRLGYKGFGGLFTNYNFENAAANGYYADANENGRSHEKKRILLNAGVHGDEKAAVYGLYYFCKSVLESSDPWAVYIKSNYVIDVIPIVSTKNYKANRRTDLDNDIDPNRNFGERTLVQVAAVAAFVDTHAGEYNLHVDCHNQSNLNAKSKCFVGCLRWSKGFEDMVEFARRFSGIARGNWGLLPWYKPHVSGGTLIKVTDPMIVIQTNASSELVADNYKMTFPSCTRTYGAVSITMEAPRQLTNVTTEDDYHVCHYDAAKLTADMLIELTHLADGARLADGNNL